MSLASLHFMDESGLRELVVGEGAHALILRALDISARHPAYLCSIDDEGRLFVQRFHLGRLVGETMVEPTGATLQVTLYSGGGREVIR